MRVHSFNVDSSLVVPVIDTIGRSDVRRLIRKYICPTLEINPNCIGETRCCHITTAERRAIATFLRFVHRNRTAKGWSKVPGACVISNMNSGKSVVFVAWEGYGDYRFAGGVY